MTEQKKKQVGWTLSLLINLLLVGCVVGLGNHYREVFDTKNRGQWVQVRILEIKPRRTKAPRTIIALHNGQPITINTRSGKFIRRCRINEFIEVKYLPEYEQYVVPDEPTTFFLILLGATTGVVILFTVTLIRAYQPIFKGA